MTMLTCKECGIWLDHELAHATSVNKDYPYCDECIWLAQEQEEMDNGQFGVGA
jgi:hypothetical protein